jgi:hypothetical protein
MQLFACLMFNGGRVVLQLIDVILEAAVLRLKLLHLDLQLARFLTLIKEGGHSVVTEDHAVAHQDGQDTGTKGGQLSPGFV